MCLWYLLQKLLQLYFGQVVAYYYGVEKLVILNALGAIRGTGILEFNSCSDHELDLFWVDMLTQLLCCISTEPGYWSYLLPVGVLNQLSLFELFVVLVWKGLQCSKLSIKNTHKKSYKMSKTSNNRLLLLTSDMIAMVVLKSYKYS